MKEELSDWLEAHTPHLKYQDVASANFELHLLNGIPEDVRERIIDKRRQVKIANVALI